MARGKGVWVGRSSGTDAAEDGLKLAKGESECSAHTLRAGNGRAYKKEPTVDMPTTRSGRSARTLRELVTFTLFSSSPGLFPSLTGLLDCS